MNSKEISYVFVHLAVLQNRSFGNYGADPVFSNEGSGKADGFFAHRFDLFYRCSCWKSGQRNLCPL